MTKTPNTLHSLLIAGLLASCCSALGCNSDRNPRTYQVSGTVTTNGKPVDKATLIFVPSNGDGYPASGITDDEGKYQLTTFKANDGAVPGDYTIKISKYNYDGASDGAEAKVFASSEDELAAYKLDEGGAAPPKNLLPLKYANPATSGLTHTVTEADTTMDIDLK